MLLDKELGALLDRAHVALDREPFLDEDLDQGLARDGIFLRKLVNANLGHAIATPFIA